MLTIIDIFESVAVPNSTISSKSNSGWKRWIFPAAGLAGAGLASAYLYSKYNQPSSNVPISTDTLFSPESKPLQQIQIPAAEKDPVDISSRQLAAPNGIRIEEPLIDRQLSSVVPSEIPKIPTHPNTTSEDKLPVVQLTNNMIDQKDRDIDGLVSNALNI